MPESRTSNLKRVALGIAALAALYVGSYAVLSARGKWVWSQTPGHHALIAGFALADLQRWQPAAAKWEPLESEDSAGLSRGNFLGFVYSPLIRLDRAFVHPDHKISDK